ncbi:MAG: cyclic nucleotide-binding protein, partial [Deltaproteobacteria bacterium]|nr:cyclic nucleotide-binding protein [Deltaproteobacteria bacterium]
MAALRLVIPLEIGFLYPVLYVLKTQYEVLLGFLFWNLANDLFNTRQSKRIFPLITAGGVCGGIIGSFGTPPLAKLISMNNLMVMYLFTTFAGAAVVKRMGDLYPTALVMTEKPGKKRAPSSMMDEFKKVIPLIKESQLAKVLILLTLLPNIVIPIMNYQFSVAVDQTYHTENGMIGFFGYFRGVQNTIALVISLFVGKLYARFGLPVALMFHPFNYMLAFFAFLFRFDIFSAMYARLSTAVLRGTINAPARAVLYGLFPISSRAVIRPFLRGTVVRVGVLAGSGVVLLSQGIMHPRYLSLVGAVVVLAWIASTIYFKRNYTKILTKLISSDTFDFRGMEENEALQVFKDKGIKSRLMQSFLTSHGDDCVWYGRMLRSLKTEGLDRHILSKLKEEDDKTRMNLLPLLSPNTGEEAIEVFRDLIDPSKPELMIAFAGTVKRVYAGMALEVQKEIFQNARYPEVKAYMIIGLYRQAPREYGETIEMWLDSDRLAERRAGVLAAGELERVEYAGKLKEMLVKEEDVSILPLILGALHRLDVPEINEIAIPYLSHASESVRRASLRVLRLESNEVAQAVVLLMGDSNDRVRGMAIEKLSSTTYPVGQFLVGSLSLPSRRVRDGIFQVFETLQVKDVKVFQFFQTQIEMGYRNLAESESLKRSAGTAEGDLLIEHLIQEKDAHVENVVRTLAVRDPEGKMRIIWRGLSSEDSRQRANSIEA